jgi:nucleoside-diphosphate-sugar epimerase
MDRKSLLLFAPPNRRNERVRAADLEQTRRLLQWQPAVSLEAGIPRTIEAFAPKEAVL